MALGRVPPEESREHPVDEAALPLVEFREPALNHAPQSGRRTLEPSLGAGGGGAELLSDLFPLGARTQPAPEEVGRRRRRLAVGLDSKTEQPLESG